LTQPRVSGLTGGTFVSFAMLGRDHHLR
jgi:hypothetical protein